MIPRRQPVVRRWRASARVSTPAIAGMPFVRSRDASWRASSRTAAVALATTRPRSHGRSDWSSSSEAAVVADQRVGHDHDLAGVRGIGADLLVAGLARVDDEVAARRDGRPERDPGKTVPSSSARSAGPRSPIRGSTIASARGSGGWPTVDGAITQVPAAAAGCRRRGMRMRILNLLPGLSGPVRRPHGTGSQDGLRVAREDRRGPRLRRRVAPRRWRRVAAEAHPVGDGGRLARRSTPSLPRMFETWTLTPSCG